MSVEKKFSPLRMLLRTLGLSEEAVDDVVNWIVDLLAGERKDSLALPEALPYQMRDHFLSPAELNFFEALRTAVNGRAVLCAKVSLGDLFQVKSDDPSRYRTYTNRIDRKHVDFLLCDAQTMQPLLGIELDDKSHQREDRRARDAFVDEVFRTAKLPILHVPAKRAYVISELAAQIGPHLGVTSEPEKAIPAEKSAVAFVTAATKLSCPKCGGEMLLRTAKSGANAGNRFWGCTNYPTCRSVLPYQESLG